MKKSLPILKEFYEHPEWRLLSNLGFLQLYTKPANEEKTIHILGRCEINHRIADIGDEISNKSIFISEDPNVQSTEVLQNVGEDIDVHYIRFKKFLVAEDSDCVILCQKIVNPEDSHDKSIVFPILSVNHYKKKAQEGIERLEITIGGWVLKSLGTNKTLVSLFFNVKMPSAAIPELLLSKHAKSMINMLRTLESICNKSIERILPQKPVSVEEREEIQEPDEEEEIKVRDDGKEMMFEQEEFGASRDPKSKCIIVKYPNDVPDIDPSTVPEHQRAFVTGTRGRLRELVDLINTGKWKRISNKKGVKIYVKKGESGLT